MMLARIPSERGANGFDHREESFGAKAKTGSLRASSGACRWPRGLGLFGNAVLAQVPEHATYWTWVGFSVQNPCCSSILSLWELL